MCFQAIGLVEAFLFFNDRHRIFDMCNVLCAYCAYQGETDISLFTQCWLRRTKKSSSPCCIQESNPCHWIYNSASRQSAMNSVVCVFVYIYACARVCVCVCTLRFSCKHYFDYYVIPVCSVSFCYCKEVVCVKARH